MPRMSCLQRKDTRKYHHNGVHSPAHCAQNPRGALSPSTYMLDRSPGRLNGAGNRRALPNNDLDYAQAMIGMRVDRSGMRIRCSRQESRIFDKSGGGRAHDVRCRRWGSRRDLKGRICWTRGLVGLDSPLIAGSVVLAEQFRPLMKLGIPKTCSVIVDIDY